MYGQTTTAVSIVQQISQRHKMLKSLVVVTLLFVADVVVCKPDYLFDQEANGWLKLHAVPAKWQEALMNCHYEGAVLASPINAKLASALQGIMDQSELDSHIYLGVTALSPGNFISVEGVPLADLLITWDTYGDGNTPEDCLSLSTRGKTYINSCTLSLPYICYKKRDNTTVLNQCGTFDDGYSYHATGSCYKHHLKRTTWVMAHKICTAEGGHLIIINDQQEADIIAHDILIPPSVGDWGEAVYIGLRDWDKDHTWITIHGEKIEDVFNTWGQDKPYQNREYRCGMFWSKGILSNVDCDSVTPAEASFICEKDPYTSRFENVTVEVYESSPN